MMGFMIKESYEISDKNRKRAEEYWLYGASPEELAKAWDKPVAIAELKKCSNCEYFDNKISTLKAHDLDTGMGVCKKFLFACSEAQACQAWDCPEMEEEEDED